MEEKEKPRLSRLTAIITQLQSKRIVTAKSLADKHGVSVRTIYRDIRTLEKSGIPIATEEGKGFSLAEGYQLPPVLFTEDEANSLITAEKIIVKNKDQSFVDNYSSAITKIKSVLKYSQKEKADLLTDRIYYGENHNYEKSSSYLMQIESAITHFQLLTISYQSSENKITKRTIEPFALYNNKGNWILIAYCRLRENFRAFRIDYIQQLTPLNETFAPHKMTIVDYFQNYVKNQNNP